MNQSVQSLSCVLLFVGQRVQQARLPCPSPTPNMFKHTSIKSVMLSNHLILYWPLLLLPSIFPSIRSFQMSQLFASGGQSIKVSASTSVLPMNIQDWSPLGWTGWISLQSKESVFSNTTVQKHQFKCILFNGWVILHCVYVPQLESVLMRWIKLEPIIQSEVSQKEKHQYNILMHIYGI